MNTDTIVKGTNSMRSLLSALLAKWRMILIFALLFALLGGAYSYRSQKNEIRSLTARKEAEDAEGAEPAVKPDYSELRREILAMLHEKTEYLENSYLAKIDPAAEGRASIDLYIEDADRTGSGGDGVILLSPAQRADTGSASSLFEITAGEAAADKILDYYIQYINTAMDVDALAESFETGESGIRELIRCGDPEYGLARVTVYTVFPTKEGAEKILDYVTERLAEAADAAETEFGSHSAVFRNRSVRTVVDDTLFTWLQARTNEINNLMSAYNNLAANAKNLDLSSLHSTTQVPSLSKKGLIKYALAGAAGGAALFCILYILYLSLSSKILCARDLNTTYGLRKIGVIPPARKKKLRGLDRAAAAAGVHYESNADPEKCYAIISDNVQCLLSENKTVGIAGDPERSEIEALCSRLSDNENSVRYVALGDLSEPSELKAADECAGILVAARPMRSTYRSTGDLIRLAADRGQKILGSIVY